MYPERLPVQGVERSHAFRRWMRKAVGVSLYLPGATFILMMITVDGALLILFLSSIVLTNIITVSLGGPCRLVFPDFTGLTDPVCLPEDCTCQKRSCPLASAVTGAIGPLSEFPLSRSLTEPVHT